MNLRADNYRMYVCVSYNKPPTHCVRVFTNHYSHHIIEDACLLMYWSCTYSMYIVLAKISSESCFSVLALFVNCSTCVQSSYVYHDGRYCALYTVGIKRECCIGYNDGKHSQL